MSAEAEELASLDRVLTRLALTDDDARLERVLDRLLPRLLTRLGDSTAVRNKTLQVLQHINKRVKDTPSIKLPCFDLVALTRQDGENSNFTVNFALVYIELGADRLSPGEKSRLAPMLCRGICDLQRAQRAIALRVVGNMLPALSFPSDAAWFTPETTSEDRACLLSYLLDWLFFVPPSRSAAARAIPPGLTPSRVDGLKDKAGNLPDADTLSEKQRAILRLLSVRVFTTEESLPLLVVARSALRHEVVDAAEMAMVQAMRVVDMDDPSLLVNLMSLAAPSVKETGQTDGSRKDASPQVRERALSVLLKAGPRGLAATAASAAVVVEDALIGSASGTSLRVLALEFMELLLNLVPVNTLSELQAGPKLALVIRKQLEQVKQYSTNRSRLHERERTYTALGRLAHRFPSLFSDSVILVSDLVGLLEIDTEIRLSIQEALGSLCLAFLPSSGASDNARATIKQLMLPYAGSAEPRARLVAADWCRRLFAFEDCESRLVCIRLACDPDLATRQVAIRGLLPELCGAHGEIDDKTPRTSSAQDRDDAGDAAANEGSEDPSTRRKRRRTERRIEKFSSWAVETLADAAAVDPSRLAMAWTDAVHLAEEHAILVRRVKAPEFPSFSAWMAFLAARTSELIDMAASGDRVLQAQVASILGFTSACLQQTQVVGTESPRTEHLEIFRSLVEMGIEAKDATQIRVLHRVASRSLVLLVEQHAALADMLQTEWLLGWLAADSPVVRENVADLVVYSPDARADPSFVKVLAERMSKRVVSATAGRHGAVLAVGRLLGDTDLPHDQAAELSTALLRLLQERSKFRIITVATIDAIGRAAARDALTLSEEDTRVVVDELRKITKVEVQTPDAVNADAETSNFAAIAGALRTLGKLALMSSDEIRADVMDVLLDAGTQKEIEVQLVIAVAFAELAQRSDEDLLAVVTHIIRKASVSTRNRVRASSAFWLLQLVRDLAAGDRVQSLLEEIHATFARLLRERGELTRECAARGMAWCFHAANSRALRDELVSSLPRHLAVKSTFMSDVKREYEAEKERKKNGGRESAVANEDDADDDDDDNDNDNGSSNNAQDADAEEAAQAVDLRELAEQLRQGVAADGTVRTIAANGPGAAQRSPVVLPLHAAYKEMYEVAIRVKRPDLVYRLLYLSVGDALWKTASTRHLRCAEFDVDEATADAGGASSGADGDETTHDLETATVNELVPILFHYRYDTDKAMRSAMTKLWETISFELGTDSEILEARLEDIVQELLQNIGSKKVRERQAGALAMSFVIRETSDADMLPFLEDIWVLSLRLLDDLSEATKEAALRLAKTLNNLTVRLCSVKEKKSERARQVAQDALDIVLPFLVEQGLGRNQSKEGQAVSVHTLARVVKAAQENIRPHLAVVMVRLLESMSSLEDQVLQYAMFHTSDQGGDLQMSREQLETMRIQASNESPMQEAVEVCIDQIPSDSDLGEICPELARLARSGVGLPTLAATARAISRIVARRELEESLKPYAGALLRGLAASLNDRSATVRRTFAGTAAAVARLAPDDQVHTYVQLLAKIYADGNEARGRLTAGGAVRELLSRNPDAFQEHRDELLPLMFLARHDDDEDIAELWQQIWIENAGTISHGVSGHLELLLPACEEALSSSTWLRKRQGAEALRSIASNVDAARLGPHAGEMLEMLVSALPGRIWSGKEAVLAATCEVWRRTRELDSVPDEYRAPENFCTNVLLPEASRTAANVPKAYTLAAFDAITSVCATGKPQSPALIEALFARAEQDDADAQIAAKSFEAIGAAWYAEVPAEQLEKVHALAQTALRGSGYIVAIGVMRALKRIFRVVPVAQDSVKPLHDVAWRCIVENKNTSAIIAALAALQAFFKDNADAETASGAPKARALASSASTRLQPLFQHREPSVVHAATSLKHALERHIRGDADE